MIAFSHWFDARSSLCEHDLAACTAHNELEHGKRLIAHGANVNGQGPCGRPLRVASALGHLAFCELLLDNGADVNANDIYGTALHAAAMCGHDKVVDLLIERDADIDRRGGRYFSAVQAAAVHGHTKIVNMLLDTQEGIDQFGFAKDILHAAVEGGQAPLLRNLLDRGYSFASCSRGHFSFDAPVLPRDLLRDSDPTWAKLKHVHQLHSDSKAEVDPLDPTPGLCSCKDNTKDEGNYALTCAATHNHLEVMKVLIEYRGGPTEHLFDQSEDDTIFRALQATTSRNLQNLPTVYSYLLEVFPLERPHRIKLLNFALDQDASCVIKHMLELTQLNVDEFESALSHVASDSGYELIAEQIKHAFSSAIADTLLVAHFERAVRQGHIGAMKSLLATYPYILADQLERALQIAVWGDHPLSAIPLLKVIGSTSLSRDLLFDLVTTATACDMVPVVDVLADYMLARLTKEDIAELLYFSCTDARANIVRFLVKDSRFTNIITSINLDIACESAYRSGNYAICASLLDLSIRSGKYFGWTSQSTGRRSVLSLPIGWTPWTNSALRRARRYVQRLQDGGFELTNVPQLPEQLDTRCEELNCARRMSELINANENIDTGRSSDDELAALVQYIAPWSMLHQLQYAAELGQCDLLASLLTKTDPHKDSGAIAEVLYRVACLERGCALPGKLLLDKLITHRGTIDMHRLLEGVLSHLQDDNARSKGLLLNTLTITEALQHGPPALLKHILGLMPEVKAVGTSYAVALQLAAAGGDNTLIELLILRGHDLNSICGYYGTALQAAAVFGHLNAVDLLLKLGADPDIWAGEHGYPLRAAVVTGNTNIVDRLIAAGAKLDPTKTDGPVLGSTAALTCALQLGDSTIALKLIAHDASVHRSSNTYCSLAAYPSTIDAGVLLAAIRGGALQNVDNCHGSHGRPCWQDAAIHAAQARRFDILEIIVQYTGVYLDLETGYNVLFELFNSRDRRRTTRYKKMLHDVLRNLDERYQLPKALKAALNKTMPRLADIHDTLSYIDCPSEVVIRACELGRLEILDFCSYKLNESAYRLACEEGFLATVRSGGIEVVQSLLRDRHVKPLLAKDGFAEDAISEAFQACADSTLLSLPWQSGKETAAKRQRRTDDYALQLGTTDPKWSSQHPRVRKYEVIIVALLEHEFQLPDEARFGSLVHLTAFLGMPLLFDRLRQPDEDLKTASRYFPDCVNAAEVGGQSFMIERISALSNGERRLVDDDLPIHRAALDKDWATVFSLATTLISTRERDEQGRSALTICLQQCDTVRSDDDTYRKAVAILLDKTYGFDDKDLDQAFCLPDTDELTMLKIKVISTILERNKWLNVSSSNFSRVKDWHGEYKGLLHAIVTQRRMTEVTADMVVMVQDVDLVRQLLGCARGCVFTTETLNAVLSEWPAHGEDCVVLLLMHDKRLLPDESIILKALQSANVMCSHEALDLMLQRRKEYKAPFSPQWLYQAKSPHQLSTLLKYAERHDQVDMANLEALLANMAYVIHSSEQLHEILSLESAHLTSDLAVKILCGSPAPGQLLDMLCMHISELEITDEALSNIIRSDTADEEHKNEIETLRKHNKPVVMTATIKHALNNRWPDGDVHGLKQMYQEYCFSDALLELDPICDEHCTGQDCLWRM